jgi:CrcB protein
MMRWTLGELVPDGSGIAWTTFAINVSGSFALALLPALGAVRSSPLLTAGLGPGLLGGFTTLSAYAEQARALFAEGRVVLAVSYTAGTLAACLLGVALASQLSSAADRRRFRLGGGEE